MNERRAICNTTFHLPLGAESPNLLVVGASGSGKTQKFMYPAFDAVAARGFGCVAINCKGRKGTRVLREIARQRNRQATVLAFRDPARSSGWNPLKEIATLGDAREVAICLGQSAREETRSQTGDGKWFDNQAIEWNTSAIHAVAQDSPENAQHLRFLRDVVLGCDYKRFAAAHPHYPALKKFERYEDSGNTNALTIGATISEHLLFADDEAVAAVIATDELRLSEFVKDGGILIVEIDEADLDALRPLTTLFIRRLFSALLRNAAASATGKLAKRCFIIIDELAAAGRIPSLHLVLNTFRERGVSMIAGTQSFGQIHDIYGPSAPAVIAGYQTQIALPGGLDSFSAEYFSRRSGVMTVDNVTVHEDYDDGFKESPPVRRSWTPVGRPVLLPSEIARPESHPLLGQPATVFLGTGTPPFHAYFPPAYTVGHLARAIERAESNTNDDRRPFPLAPPSSANETAAGGSSSLSMGYGISVEQIRHRYTELKQKLLTPSATEAVRKAWARFEEENEHRPEFLLRVSEELSKRGQSISDLLCASSHTKSDSLSANLAYLDYLLRKREGEAKERDTKSRHERGLYRTGERVPAPGGIFRLLAPFKMRRKIDLHQLLQEFAADSVFPQFGGMAVEWERTNMRRKGSKVIDTILCCSNCKSPVVVSGGTAHCPHCGVQKAPETGP